MPSHLLNFAAGVTFSGSIGSYEQPTQHPEFTPLRNKWPYPKSDPDLE